MNKEQLIEQIQSKKSVLCVGLDTDFYKLPAHLQTMPLKEALITFNRAIINATSDYAVAYKINTAFYEQYGAMGWQVMEETLAVIPKTCFTIADAKRGDIGNTSKMYAKAFFETLSFDAITVAPYMGDDSIAPFFEYENKWVICLGLTSNKGSENLQAEKLENGQFVYEHTMEFVSKIAHHDRLMFVTGATHPAQLKSIREKFPNHFFLVPGVGAQGGSVKEVCDAAFIKHDAGLLINSSRGIIYKSSDKDFAEQAGNEAKNMVAAMKAYFE